MQRFFPTLLWAFVFVSMLTTQVLAGNPAARLGDRTTHGGTIVHVATTNVFINGLPAAAVGDYVVCPVVEPYPYPVPHVGGPIATGSTSVFINGMPACRVGDMVVEQAGPPSFIVTGSPNVLIGD